MTGPLYNPPDTIELLAHCVALEAEIDRLREANEGWSCEVNRIEGELQSVLVEYRDVRETAKALLRHPRSARRLANLRAALEEA